MFGLGVEIELLVKPRQYLTEFLMKNFYINFCSFSVTKASLRTEFKNEHRVDSYTMLIFKPPVCFEYHIPPTLAKKSNHCIPQQYFALSL